EKLNIVFEEEITFKHENNEIYQQWEDEMNSHWNDISQEDENFWDDIEDRPTYTVDSEKFEEDSSNSLIQSTVEENRSTDSSQDTLVELSVNYQIELTFSSTPSNKNPYI
ncbi:17470_t:CDS:2, partial [Racocetra fulgida]